MQSVNLNTCSLEKRKKKKPDFLPDSRNQVFPITAITFVSHFQNPAVPIWLSQFKQGILRVTS